MHQKAKFFFFFSFDRNKAGSFFAYETQHIPFSFISPPSSMFCYSAISISQSPSLTYSNPPTPHWSREMYAVQKTV